MFLSVVGSVRLDTSFSGLCRTSRTLIEHCTSKKITLGGAEDNYNLIRKWEAGLPEPYHLLKNYFVTAKSFRSHLDTARKIKVREEIWKRAVVKLDSESNTTGVFRSGVDLLRAEMRKAGGVDYIHPLKESFVRGVRAFWAPCDTISLCKYSEGSIRMVPVDVYSNGKLLLKCGSQSGNKLRVWFPTLKEVE